jgi:hypothetical protein
LAFSLAGQPGAAIQIADTLLQKRLAGQDLAVKQANLQARYVEEVRRRQQFVQSEEHLKLEKAKFIRKVGEDEEAALAALTKEQRAKREEEQKLRKERDVLYGKAITGFRTDVEQVVKKTRGINLPGLATSLLRAGVAQQVALAAISPELAGQLGDTGQVVDIVKGVISEVAAANQSLFESPEQAAAAADAMSSEIAGLYQAHLSTLAEHPQLIDRFISNAPYLVPRPEREAELKAQQIIEQQGAGGPGEGNEAKALVLTPEDTHAIASAVGQGLSRALTDGNGLTFEEYRMLATAALATFVTDQDEGKTLEETAQKPVQQRLDKATYDTLLLQLDEQIELSLLAVEAREPFESPEEREAMKALIENTLLDFLEQGKVPNQGLFRSDLFIETPDVKVERRKKLKAKPFGEASPETKARRERLRNKTKRGK